MSTMDPTGDGGGGGGGTSASIEDNMTPGTPSTDIVVPPGSQHQHHPPPSPLSGCYLLVVLPEPHTAQHRDLILNRLAKGFLSWDKDSCHVDLEKELQALVAQAPEGEEARNGERLIQYATENLVTEVLIHPQTNTLLQCMRNLLASFTKHRHIIHAGYTFGGNGSWILQDGTFSLADFLDAFSEHEVQRVLRAYENSVTVDINCAGVGEWSTSRLSKEACTRSCRVRLNPDDVLTAGVGAITSFTNYVGQYLLPQTLDQLMEPSDVVGNIRFSHPTLYVFPGGQGDAALFGINGFNMLVDGGFARKACFWDFARHLDRLDAVLVTRVNNSNVGGMSSVLRKKREMHVYPQIGHFFCNLVERRHSNSPDGDKDLDPLTLNLIDIGQEMMVDLRQINLRAHPCYRDPNPINLYHKVGHGTLDMYVLSPSKDSREVREFLSKWHSADSKLFAGSHKKDSNNLSFPIQNLASICALLVWQPANPEDTITRILFPGSTPQHKIFEGFERIKHLEFLKHPVCTAKNLSPSTSLLTLKDRPTIKQKLTLGERESKKSYEPKREKRDFPESKLSKAAAEEILPKATSQTTPVMPTQKSAQQPKIDIKSKKVVENRKIETDSKKIEKELKEIKKESVKRDIGKMEKDGETKKGEVTRTKSDSERISAKDTKIKVEAKKKDAKDPKIGKISKIDAKPAPKVSDKKSKPLVEKKDTAKASPPTPKKTLNGSATKAEISSKPMPRPITKPTGKQASLSSMPAKSAKDANNRKVVEQKNIEIASAASAVAPGKSSSAGVAATTTAAKPKTLERKPISRRPKAGSPIKSRVPASPAKSTRSTPTTSVKSDKDGVIRKVKGDRGTTDSSTVSTPSGIEIDSITKLADKSLTEKSEDMSLDSIESKVLADLKEEREVVEEIEAVLQKAERIEEARKDDHLDGDDDITAEATDKKEDDMTEDDVTADIEEAPKKKTSRKPSQELTEEDEYLIVEKEEIYIEDSAQSGEGEQKHVLDAVESEKAKPVDVTKEEEEEEEEDEQEEAEEEEEEAAEISEEKEKSDVPEKKLLYYDEETIDKDKEAGEISPGHKEQLKEEMKDIIASAAEIVQKTEDKDDSGKKDSEDMTKEASSLSPDKFDSSEKKTTDTDPMKPEVDQQKDQQVGEKMEESQERISTLESGATTTAPTLPEDERIPLDEIKEVIDEKYVAEEVREKESVEQVKETFVASAPVEPKPDAKSFQVRATIQGIQREIVKTPDEVADLPVHEEVDPKLYRMEDFEKAKDDKTSVAPSTVAHQQETKEPPPVLKEQKGVFSFFGKVADKFEKGMDKLTGKSRRDSEKDIDEKSSSKSSSPKEAKIQELVFPSEREEAAVKEAAVPKTIEKSIEKPEIAETFEKGEPEISKIKVAAITDTAAFLQREIEDLTAKSANLGEETTKDNVIQAADVAKPEIQTESAISTDPVFETCVLKGQQKDILSQRTPPAEDDAEDVEALLEEASKKFKTVKDSLRDSLESLEDKIVEEEMVRAELAAASKDVVKDTLSEVVEKLEEIKPHIEEATTTTTTTSTTILDIKEPEKVKFEIPKSEDLDIDEDMTQITKDLKGAVRDVGEVLAGSAGILIDEKPKDVVEIVKKVAEVLKKDDFLSHDVLFEKEDDKKSDDKAKDDQSPSPVKPIVDDIIPKKVGVTEELPPQEEIEEIVESGITTAPLESFKPSIDDEIHEEPCVKTISPKGIEATSPMRDLAADKIDAMKICSDLMEEETPAPSRRKRSIHDDENDYRSKSDVMESGIESICVKQVIKPETRKEDEPREIEDSDIVFDRKLSPDKAQLVIVTPDSAPMSPQFPGIKTQTREEIDEVPILPSDVKSELDKDESLEKVIQHLVLTKKIKVTKNIIEYITIVRKIPREKVIYIIEEIIIERGIPRESVVEDLDLLKHDVASSEKRAEIEEYIDREYIKKNIKITVEIVEEISVKKFVNKRIVIEVIEEIIVKRKIKRDDVLDISENELSRLGGFDKDETVVLQDDGESTIVEEKIDEVTKIKETSEQDLHSEIEQYILDDVITKGVKVTPQFIDDISIAKRISRRTFIEILESVIVRRKLSRSKIIDISEKELSEIIGSEKDDVDQEEIISEIDKEEEAEEEEKSDRASLTSETRMEIEKNIIDEYITKNRRITPYIFEEMCRKNKVSRHTIIIIIEELVVKHKVPRSSVLDISDVELEELLAVEKDDKEDEEKVAAVASEDEDEKQGSEIEEYETVTNEKIAEIENSIIDEFVSKSRRITPYIFEDICVRYEIPRRILMQIIEEIIVKRNVTRASILDITDVELSELLAAAGEAEDEDAGPIGQEAHLPEDPGEDKLVDGFVSIPDKIVSQTPTDLLPSKTVELAEAALKESEKDVADDFEAVEQEYKIHATQITTKEATFKAIDAQVDEEKLGDGMEEAIDDDVSDVVEADEKTVIGARSPITIPTTITEKKTEDVSESREKLHSPIKPSDISLDHPKDEEKTAAAAARKDSVASRAHEEDICEREEIGSQEKSTIGHTEKQTETQVVAEVDLKPSQVELKQDEKRESKEQEIKAKSPIKDDISPREEHVEAMSASEIESLTHEDVEPGLLSTSTIHRISVTSEDQHEDQHSLHLSDKESLRTGASTPDKDSISGKSTPGIRDADKMTLEESFIKSPGEASDSRQVEDIPEKLDTIELKQAEKPKSPSKIEQDGALPPKMAADRSHESIKSIVDDKEAKFEEILDDKLEAHALKDSPVKSTDDTNLGKLELEKDTESKDTTITESPGRKESVALQDLSELKPNLVEEGIVKIEESPKSVKLEEDEEEEEEEPMKIKDQVSEEKVSPLSDVEMDKKRVERSIDETSQERKASLTIDKNAKVLSPEVETKSPEGQKLTDPNADDDKIAAPSIGSSVHRMLVTVSSEDGGQDKEISPTIDFCGTVDSTMTEISGGSMKTRPEKSMSEGDSLLLEKEALRTGASTPEQDSVSGKSTPGTTDNDVEKLTPEESLVKSPAESRDSQEILAAGAKEVDKKIPGDDLSPSPSKAEESVSVGSKPETEDAEKITGKDNLVKSPSEGSHISHDSEVDISDKSSPGTKDVAKEIQQDSSMKILSEMQEADHLPGDELARETKDHKMPDDKLHFKAPESRDLEEVVDESASTTEKEAPQQQQQQSLTESEQKMKPSKMEVEKSDEAAEEIIPAKEGADFDKIKDSKESTTIKSTDKPQDIEDQAKTQKDTSVTATHDLGDDIQGIELTREQIVEDKMKMAHEKDTDLRKDSVTFADHEKEIIEKDALSKVDTLTSHEMEKVQKLQTDVAVDEKISKISPTEAEKPKESKEAKDEEQSPMIEDDFESTRVKRSVDDSSQQRKDSLTIGEHDKVVETIKTELPELKKISDEITKDDETEISAGQLDGKMIVAASDDGKQEKEVHSSESMTLTAAKTPDDDSIASSTVKATTDKDSLILEKESLHTSGSTPEKESISGKSTPGTKDGDKITPEDSLVKSLSEARDSQEFEDSLAKSEAAETQAEKSKKSPIEPEKEAMTSKLDKLIVDSDKSSETIEATIHDHESHVTQKLDDKSPTLTIVGASEDTMSQEKVVTDKPGPVETEAEVKKDKDTKTAAHEEQISDVKAGVDLEHPHKEVTETAIDKETSKQDIQQRKDSLSTETHPDSLSISGMKSPGKEKMMDEMTEDDEGKIVSSPLHQMAVTSTGQPDEQQKTEVCSRKSIDLTVTKTPDDSLRSSPVKTTPDQDSLLLDKESLRTGASTPEKDSIFSKSTPGTKEGDEITPEDSLDKSPLGTHDSQDLEDSLAKSDSAKLEKEKKSKATSEIKEDVTLPGSGLIDDKGDETVDKKIQDKDSHHPVTLDEEKTTSGIVESTEKSPIKSDYIDQSEKLDTPQKTCDDLLDDINQSKLTKDMESKLSPQTDATGRKDSVVVQDSDKDICEREVTSHEESKEKESTRKESPVAEDKIDTMHVKSSVDDESHQRKDSISVQEHDQLPSMCPTESTEIRKMSVDITKDVETDISTKSAGHRMSITASSELAKPEELDIATSLKSTTEQTLDDSMKISPMKITSDKDSLGLEKESSRTGSSTPEIDDVSGKSTPGTKDDDKITSEDSLDKSPIGSHDSQDVGDKVEKLDITKVEKEEKTKTSPSIEGQVTLSTSPITAGSTESTVIKEIGTAAEKSPIEHEEKTQPQVVKAEDDKVVVTAPREDIKDEKDIAEKTDKSVTPKTDDKPGTDVAKSSTPEMKKELEDVEDQESQGKSPVADESHGQSSIEEKSQQLKDSLPIEGHAEVPSIRKELPEEEKMSKDDKKDISTSSFVHQIESSTTISEDGKQGKVDPIESIKSTATKTPDDSLISSPVKTTVDKDSSLFKDESLITDESKSDRKDSLFDKSVTLQSKDSEKITSEETLDKLPSSDSQEVKDSRDTLNLIEKKESDKLTSPIKMEQVKTPTESSASVDRSHETVETISQKVIEPHQVPDDDKLIGTKIVTTEDIETQEKVETMIKPKEVCEAESSPEQDTKQERKDSVASVQDQQKEGEKDKKSAHEELTALQATVKLGHPEKEAEMSIKIEQKSSELKKEKEKDTKEEESKVKSPEATEKVDVTRPKRSIDEVMIEHRKDSMSMGDEKEISDGPIDSEKIISSTGSVTSTIATTTTIISEDSIKSLSVKSDAKEHDSLTLDKESLSADAISPERENISGKSTPGSKYSEKITPSDDGLEKSTSESRVSQDLGDSRAKMDSSEVKEIEKLATKVEGAGTASEVDDQVAEVEQQQHHETPKDRSRSHSVFDAGEKTPLGRSRTASLFEESVPEGLSLRSEFKTAFEVASDASKYQESEELKPSTDDLSIKSSVEDVIQDLSRKSSVKDAIEDLSPKSSVKDAIEDLSRKSSVKDAVDDLSQKSSVKDVMEDLSRKSSVKDAVEDLSQKSSVKDTVEDMSRKSSVKDALEDVSRKSSIKDAMEDLSQKSSVKDVMEDLSQKSSVKDALEDVSRKSSIKDAMEDLSQKSSVKDVMEDLSQKSSVKDVMEDMSRKSSVKDAMEDLSRKSSVKDAMEDLSQKSSVKDVMEDLSQKSSVKDAMEDLSQKSSVKDAMEDVSRKSSVKDAMEDLSQKSSVKDAVEDMSRKSSFKDAMEDLSRKSSVKDAMEDLSQKSSVKDAMEDLSRKSSVKDAMEDLSQKLSSKDAGEDMSRKSSVKDVMEDLSRKSSVKDAMEDLSQKSSVKDAVEDMSRKSSVKDVMEDLSPKSSIKDTIEDLSRKSSVKDAMEDLSQKSSVKDTVEDMSRKSSVKDVIEDLSPKSSVKDAIEDLSQKSSVKDATEDLSRKSSVKDVMEDVSSKSSVKDVVDDLSTKSSVKDLMEDLSRRSSIKDATDDLSGVPSAKDVMAEKKDSISSDSRKSSVGKFEDATSKQSNVAIEEDLAEQFAQEYHTSADEISNVEEYIVNRYIIKNEKITSRVVDEIVMIYSMPKYMILELIEAIIMKKNVPRDFVVDYPKFEETSDSDVTSKDYHVDVIDISPDKRQDIESYIRQEFITKNRKISSKAIHEMSTLKSVSIDIIMEIIEEINDKVNISEILEDGAFEKASKLPDTPSYGPMKIQDRIYDEENLPSISTEYHISSGPSISTSDIRMKDESHLSSQKRVQVETYVMEECVKKGKKITVLVLEEIMTKMSISRSDLLDLIENIIVTRKMSRETMVDNAIYDEVDRGSSKSPEILSTKDRIIELSGKSTPDPKSSGYSTPETRQYDNDKFSKEISSYSNDYESPFHKAFVGGMTEIRTTHITTLSGKSTPDFGARGETPESLSDSITSGSQTKLEEKLPPSHTSTSEIHDAVKEHHVSSISSVGVAMTTSGTTSSSALDRVSEFRDHETSVSSGKVVGEQEFTEKKMKHDIVDEESKEESHLIGDVIEVDSKEEHEEETTTTTKIIDTQVISEEEPEVITRVIRREVIVDDEPEVITRVIRRRVIEGDGDDDEDIAEGTQQFTISRRISGQDGSPDTFETVTTRTTKTIVTDAEEPGSTYVTRVTTASPSGGPISADIKRTITTVTTVTDPDGKVTTKKDVQESSDTLEGDELLEKLIDSTKTDDNDTVTDAKSIESLKTEKIITETIKTVSPSFGVRGDVDSDKSTSDSGLLDEKSHTVGKIDKTAVQSVVDDAKSSTIKDIISDEKSYTAKSSTDMAKDIQSSSWKGKSTAPDIIPASTLSRDVGAGGILAQTSGRSTPDKRADGRSRTATPEGFRSSEVIRTTITTTRTMSEDGDIITTTKEITEATNEKGQVTILKEKTDVKVEDRIIAEDIGDISPTRDLHSRVGPQVWPSSEDRHTYSDEEIPGSPFSTTSQVGYSPQSTYHFGEQSFGKESSNKSIEFSEADMSSSFYGELPDLPPRVTTLQGAYLDSGASETSTSSGQQATTEDFTFKKFTVEKELASGLSEKSGGRRYVDDADLDFEKALMERKEIKRDRGDSHVTSASIASESTKPSFSSSPSEQPKDPKDDTKKKDPLDDWGTPLGLPSPIPPRKFNLRTTPRPTESHDISPDSLNFDAINDWGEPLRLPSPAPVADEASNKATPLTPKKERKQPKKVISENMKNRKRSESPSKNEKKTKDAKNKVQPVYMDLTYVPHHGNSYYTSLEFFKRIRARYYVFSGTEPSREVYDALLDAKKTWEDKDLEVTMIPTYDTDTLGYWVADNEEALAANHIDLSPSASRCTINLQDHETSCSAYRLEF